MREAKILEDGESIVSLESETNGYFRSAVKLFVESDNLLRRKVKTGRYTVKDIIYLGRIHLELGRAYASTNKFREAERAYQMSLNFFRKANAVTQIPSILNNLADLNITLKRPAEVRRYSEMSLELATRYGLIIYKAIATANLGIAESLEGRVDTAKELLLSAREIAVKAGNMYGLVQDLDRDIKSL